MYIMIGLILVAFALGGPFVGALCGAGGVLYMYYLCFKWGPKLTLIAIPVAICVFLCMWLDDFVWIYAKHILKYVLICLLVTVVFCHYYYEEGYAAIVIGVTAAFTVVTMGLLAGWMYMPREFPVPDGIDRIEIQQMSEPIQAIYPNPAEFEELLEQLDRVEMCGTFKELVDSKGIDDTYRLTFRNQKGKEIETYYFLSKYYIAKPMGKRLIFYRWSEDSRFPYAKLTGMYEYALALDGKN